MLETLRAFSLIEWIGLITGIVYVILSAQNKIICWYFGIVSCACIAYHDFFGDLKLYSDGLLQIFYIIIGVFGLLKWQKVDIKISSSKRLHLVYISVGIIVSLLYGLLMSKLFDAAFPMIDAFTTVFSVIATLLLVNRMLSSWVYFVLIDITMTVLYYIRGYELYSLLYLIFTLVAIYAIWQWSRLFRINLNK